MKPYVLFLFFILSLALCSFQQKPTYSMDQKKIIDLFESKRNAFRKEKIYDSAIVYTQKLIPQYEAIDDSIMLAKSYHRLGFYNKKIFDFTKSFESLNKSFILYAKLKDSIQAGNRLVDMSDIQAYLGDYIGSEIMAIDALRYLDQTDNYKNIAGAYQSIAVNKKERGYFLEAQKWNQKAIDLLSDSIAKNKIAEFGAIEFFNTNANIQVKQGNYTKGIEIYSDLLKNKTEVKINNVQRARLKDNLGFSMWLNDSLDIESIKLMREALQLRNDLDHTSGLIASNIHLAKYYSLSDPYFAMKYVSNALENAKKIGNAVAIMEALEILIGLKNKLNENVNTESELYITTNSNLEIIKNRNRNIYEATKYRSDQLEKEKLIALQQKTESDLGKQKADNKNLILLFTTILLGLLSLGIYYRQNQKSKQKQLQERYLTESRISKKIHDELANDVFQVMSQLELQKAPDETLDQLDGIYQKTRDISKEHQPIDTNTSFPKTLSTMLSSLVPEHAKLVLRGLDNFKWEMLNMQKKTELYRSLQELMTNMKRHSQATHITIAFTKVDQVLKIYYSDNGVGIQTANYQKGGLQNVESRIASIKGILTFETDDISGLKAEIQIPV